MYKFSELHVLAFPLEGRVRHFLWEGSIFNN